MMTEKVRQIFFDDELMTGLFKAGFISSKAFLHRDIFLWITTQVEVRKISQYKAIIEAEDKFSVSKTTIKTALRSFRIYK